MQPLLLLNSAPAAAPAAVFVDEMMVIVMMMGVVPRQLRLQLQLPLIAELTSRMSPLPLSPS